MPVAESQLVSLAMALFGVVLERLVIRPILGQPQFSIVMLTIGIGYVARGLITMIPGIGTETHTLPVPYKDEILKFGGNEMGIGALVLNVEHLVIIGATGVLVNITGENGQPAFLKLKLTIDPSATASSTRNLGAVRSSRRSTSRPCAANRSAHCCREVGPPSSAATASCSTEPSVSSGRSDARLPLTARSMGERATETTVPRRRRTSSSRRVSRVCQARPCTPPSCRCCRRRPACRGSATSRSVNCRPTR